MEPIFRQTFPVTEAAVDCYGRLRPSMVLQFSQEVAGDACTALSVDYDTLARKGMFWAISRTRVQITRLPRLGETITLETWAMPTTRVAYPRSTVAYDREGNECFRAISLWVLMDLNSRNMILPGKSGILVPGTLRGNELPSPRTLAPRDLVRFTDRTVRYSQLDRNGHMNNTRYLDWVEDLLPSAFHREHTLAEFTVCYHSECLEGQTIRLHYALEDGNSLTVDGYGPEPESPEHSRRAFSVQALFN